VPVRACVSDVSKCTGDKPCKTCKKANIDCRYEEIQRKKPRAVLLEERVGGFVIRDRADDQPSSRRC
jgi:hypothetical protein